ncbi:MAG: DUF2306 domain-containing protein [Planctomycetaceae bacterium]|nr:DUF2306 domain-containing protein [Planctomycetaceae bacterium]
MQIALSQKTYRALKWLMVLLIIKVTIVVLIGYRDYFPPNFESSFLLGRQNYFWGPYSRSFYTHLLSGPPTLILGLLLMSHRFRSKYPGWHRRLGKIQVGVILLLLVPSGLWMSWYAMTGWIAGLGLAASALAVAICTIAGWKAATEKRFQTHQLWMVRCYAILLSAIVIRVLGGLATVAEWSSPGVYQFSAWFSWIFPLICVELTRIVRVARAPAQSLEVAGAESELSAS